MDARAIISRHSDLAGEAENQRASWRHPVVEDTQRACGDARFMRSDVAWRNVG
jgi:hypothetical protein